MRDGAYIKRLGADLERWRGSGVVSAEQANALLADARDRAEISKSNPAAVAAALGAILFGLGLITFIAANWGLLPKGGQLLAALALIWITFGGVILALERGAGWIGHAFALVGALAIGASVALIGQIYHIEGTPAGLFFIWMIGAGATAIAFRSVPVLILYVILAFAWYVADQPGAGLFGVFIDSERTGSWKDFGLQYLPFWALGAFMGRRWDSGAAMHMSGLALLLWVIAVCGDAVWLDTRPEWLFVGLMIAGAGFVIASIGEYIRNRLGERSGGIALAWGAATMLCGLVVAQFAVREDQPISLEIMFAAAVLALCTWAISWGEAPGRRAVRGLAVAGFTFECIFIYVILFGGLQNTALFLLGGGALLFALAFGLRFLTRKKAPPPAPAEAAP